MTKTTVDKTKLKTAFYLNPQAGGRQSAFALEQIEALSLYQEAKELGLIFEKALSDAKQRQNAVKSWLREQISSDVRQFVAVGGDGTIHFLLNALMSVIEEDQLKAQDFALGSIALGSSNDFHKDEQGVRPFRLDFAKAKATSLGLAKFGDHKQYFAVNASLGLTAAVNDFFNHRPQWLSRLASFNMNLAITSAALTTLCSYKAFQGQLEIGQGARRKTSSLRVTNIGFSRQKFFGGSFSYGRLPKGEALACFVSDNLSKLEILKNMMNLSKGRFLETEKNRYFEAQRFLFKAEQSFPLELDGEIYQIQGQALQMTTCKGPRICP